MGALILYMISGGFTTTTPDEITLQDFVKLVEDKKVQAVHETLGSGLYTGLYTGSNYTIKDLPNRADFTFTCSEEEFSKNMSLLIARMQGKDADAVSSVDYPFLYTRPFRQTAVPSLSSSLRRSVVLLERLSSSAVCFS